MQSPAVPSSPPQHLHVRSTEAALLAALQRMNESLEEAADRLSARKRTYGARRYPEDGVERNVYYGYREPVSSARFK